MRLILRLRTVLALAVFALAMLARLLLVLIALGVVAQIGLRLLHRDEPRLLAEARETVDILLAIIGARGLIAALLLLRLVLAELLLRRGDQAEVMLGVLVVVLGGDRIA